MASFQQKCNACGSTNIDYDPSRGDNVCTDCSQVEDVISEETIRTIQDVIGMSIDSDVQYAIQEFLTPSSESNDSEDELDLEGIDDNEIDGYILTDEEIKLKEQDEFDQFDNGDLSAREYSSHNESGEEETDLE